MCVVDDCSEDGMNDDFQEKGESSTVLAWSWSCTRWSKLQHSQGFVAVVTTASASLESMYSTCDSTVTCGDRYGGLKVFGKSG